MSTVLLCISAGRGPVECREAVKRAHQELCREAALCGVEVASGPNEGTFASVTMYLDGAQAEVLAQSWEGTIQWIFKSSKRSGIGRRNWFVAVKRLEPPQRRFAMNGIRFETLRAGGPGGQHQNKTESAVRATHLATGIAVVARDGRSQHRNMSLAIARLQSLLRARSERSRSKIASKEWSKKITVERGRPVRVCEGPDFVRRRGE